MTESWLTGQLERTPQELIAFADQILRDHVQGVKLRLEERAALPVIIHPPKLKPHAPIILWLKKDELTSVEKPSLISQLTHQKLKLCSLFSTFMPTKDTVLSVFPITCSTRALLGVLVSQRKIPEGTDIPFDMFLTVLVLLVPFQ